MTGILVNMLDNLKNIFVNISHEQVKTNKETQDALLETYETTETKTAELEDAMIELYELVSESEVK